MEATRKFRFALDSPFALWAYRVAETGGPAGASVVGLLMLLFLVTRAGISMTRRLIETGAIFSLVVILGGGGAARNEYVIKPIFEIPRPNLAYLAKYYNPATKLAGIPSALMLLTKLHSALQDAVGYYSN
jgi:hypothetical protein